MSEAELIAGPLCGRMDYDKENVHESARQPTPPQHAPNESEMTIPFLPWPSTLYNKIR